MNTDAALVCVACVAAATSGCIVTCECETAFEAACRERGGYVMQHGPSQSCIAADGGVLASTADDEDAGS